MSIRLTNSRLRHIIKEELGRVINEMDSMDSMGSGSNEVITAYQKMHRKPTGVIIDCSFMESTGGGPYPAYIGDGVTATKISDDVGNVAYDLLDLIAERGRLPVGIYTAGPNPDTGVFEITNR